MNAPSRLAEDLAKKPLRLKAGITRGAHRSTLFTLAFDISPLLDQMGEALVEGDELEWLLMEWCRSGVRSQLDQARKAIKGHP